MCRACSRLLGTAKTLWADYRSTAILSCTTQAMVWTFGASAGTNRVPGRTVRYARRLIDQRAVSTSTPVQSNPPTSLDVDSVWRRETLRMVPDVICPLICTCATPHRLDQSMLWDIGLACIQDDLLGHLIARRRHYLDGDATGGGREWSGFERGEPLPPLVVNVPSE